MKKKITRKLLPIMLGMCVILQFSCKDDNSSGGNYDGPLKLTKFYPDSGYLSSKIIIEGENLGTDASKLSVYFNKKKGFISQASGNILMVYAPKLPGDICDISVVKGKDSLVFDNKFRYIARLTVDNVCGKAGSPTNLGGDLQSTTFAAWRLQGCTCDPEGNLYICLNNPGAPGEGILALVSEKHNLSKRLTGVPVNDVIYHNATKKLYAADMFRNLIYEIDPANDWKVKNKYLKRAEATIDYDRIATLAYCTANDYFYAHTTTKQLIRFKLDDMVCELVNTDKFHGGTAYSINIRFDPTEPTMLYTSYGESSVITVQDISRPEQEEKIYAGQLNQRADVSQVFNGYRTDCLLNWNNSMVITADGSGQKLLYFSDPGTSTIRQIDMVTGFVTTAVGRAGIPGNQSGSPEESTFNWPTGVAINPDGDLYIADQGSGCIRKLSLR